MRRSRRETEFDDFFAARAPAMRRIAFLIVRDWHTAEDVVQATFVKLYVAWPRIRPETLDGYARRTLVNTCISQTRKLKWEQVTDNVPDTARDSETDVRLDLAAALALLSPAQRGVVALRFVEDLPVADVARLLGMAEGTVKSHTARAMATLRENIPELALTED